MEILQLWVNLPSRLKMTAPNYVGLQSADIPKVTLDDGRVTVEAVSGRWAGTEAPIQSLIDVQMAVVRFKADGTFEAPVEKSRNVFLYVVSGDVTVGGTPVPAWNLAALNEDGDAVRIEASGDAVVLLGHAAPIGEPVFAHGPFVMNTREEIIQAVQDYQTGKFGPPPPV